MSTSILAVTPSHVCNARIAVAACRSGQAGILDMGYRSPEKAIRTELERLAGAAAGGTWGARWDALGLPARSVETVARFVPSQIPILILAGIKPEGLADELSVAHGVAKKVFVEVSRFSDVGGVQDAGCDGIVLKGHEAGGRVSEHSSFILLQRAFGHLNVPYWIEGGMGLRTIGAAVVAGAAGVVLREQLWLTKEAPFSPEERLLWSNCDGSETLCIGEDDEYFRIDRRLCPAELREALKSSMRGEGTFTALAERLLGEPEQPIIPCGQDIGLAGGLARSYGTVGGVIQALVKSCSDNLGNARKNRFLRKGAPLARVHGLSYPVVQGPMTRVSDVAPFSKAVADAGGLPVLALALMQETELRALLSRTKSEMDGLPWGVGILGFVPAELRQEQLRVVQEFRPPFAVVAGGRPGQARELESAGISTYLHVPSPELLKNFIEEGARSFVFEGRECGGHVGPRTSFVLWEAAVEALLRAKIDDPGGIRVLFAGGIHDGLSGAMVEVIGAPLAARGMKLGVLMGTAYLFTTEAVQSGAITPEFQSQALASEGTAILETGFGHAIRCAMTPYVEEFRRYRQELLSSGKSSDEARMALELLNIGRLRIASKGLKRKGQPSDLAGEMGIPKGELCHVDRDVQRREGMFMLGEIAALRNATVSLGELHKEVCEGAGRYLRKTKSAGHSPRKKATKAEDVAIIGMACMFPEAEDVRQFWQNIINKVDCIREVPKERWNPADYYAPDRFSIDKVYSKWGAFLGEMVFDPLKYGIPPASVKSIEPLQLMSLEIAWRALDDAGYIHREFPRDRTAVFFAATGAHQLVMDLMFRAVLPGQFARLEHIDDELRKEFIQSFYSILPEWTEDSFPGTLLNLFSGRVANRLDLGGANFTVDAACATSMAALDTAAMHLRNHRCDMAIVGGEDGTNHAGGFLAFSRTQALSPRGKSCPFDESADGIVLGEGVAAVVLKRLPDAERDGDDIYAVLKGFGCSSDGRNRSLVAPWPEGQIRALLRAYEDAGRPLRAPQMIEAHGTGTAAGDKAEIDSLCRVFQSAKSSHQSCAIGSIKSMIGHGKAVAGLAGLIKTALALKHKILPPTSGVKTPNPSVDFSKTPLYIAAETRPWFAPEDGGARRAGVSAFGFGGTNFHIVLEEYARAAPGDECLDFCSREAEVFLFARPSKSELATAIRQLADHLEKTPGVDLAQLAHSVRIDESRLRQRDGTGVCRLGLVATSVADLTDKLAWSSAECLGTSATEKHNPKGTFYSERTPEGKVVFLFPGQGSQSIHMMVDLVLSRPECYSLFERADRLLADRLSQPLTNSIFPLPVFSDPERAQQQEHLRQTRIAQPALGLMGLTAYDTLAEYGLRPDFLAGHSYGELVALCAAGVMGRDDLILLSERRGATMEEAARDCPGRSVAVNASRETVAKAIDDLKLRATLAALNAPNQTVISGDVEAVDQAVVEFKRAGFATREVEVSGAFHSLLMRSAMERWSPDLEKTALGRPQVPVFSNLGGLYGEDADDARQRLLRLMCQPADFMAAVLSAYEAGARIFVEAGPNRVLTGLVSRILESRPHTVLSIDAPGRSTMTQLAFLLAQAFALGLPVDLAPWFRNRRLAHCAVEEALKEAQTRATPGKLSWRISPSAAVPCHQDVIPARHGTQEKASPRILSQGDPRSWDGRGKDGDGPLSDMIPWGSPASGEAQRPSSLTRPEMTSQLTKPSQFLDLIREQQVLMHRYLDLQEKALKAGADLSELRPTANKPGAFAGVPVPAGGVPPTPVLPDEVVTAISSQQGGQGQAPLAPLPLVREISAEKLPSTEEFQELLIATVSKRTGYPREMIDLDAHVEADLGIDSIKLVEIMATLERGNALPRLENEEELLEELAQIKTLRGIIRWYDGNREALQKKAKRPMVAIAQAEPLSLPAAPARESQSEGATRIMHFSLAPVPAPLNGSGAKLTTTDRPILLLGGLESLRKEFVKVFQDRANRIIHLLPATETRALSGNVFNVSFESLETVRQFRQMLSPDMENVAGVLGLMGTEEPLTNGSDPEGLDEARKLFLLLKVFGDALRSSIPAAWLVNVSMMDGRFGLRGHRPYRLSHAATVGLLKTVAKEWPEVLVKCIDIEADGDVASLPARILAELESEDPLVEVGLSGEDRWRIEPIVRRRRAGGDGHLPLDSDSVILVTGGAYGITAEVVKALAEASRPHIVIVGRSRPPEEERPEIRGLPHAQALRDYFIEDARRRGARTQPAAIDGQVQQILRNRQICSNLAAMRGAGSEVEYHSLDVRESERFGEYIDGIYERHGRLDGVIHGAGVIRDKRIDGKSPEAFAEVFETKVSPALVLAKKVRPEGLKFLAFFSSLAARFGNPGQSDYTAANEVLNKLARRLGREWPARVISFCWGPWDTGMVSEELKAMYDAKSIKLISCREGVQAFMSELRADERSEEVLVLAVTDDQLRTGNWLV